MQFNALYSFPVEQVRQNSTSDEAVHVIPMCEIVLPQNDLQPVNLCQWTE